MMTEARNKKGFEEATLLVSEIEESGHKSRNTGSL